MQIEVVIVGRVAIHLINNQGPRLENKKTNNKTTTLEPK